MLHIGPIAIPSEIVFLSSSLAVLLIQLLLCLKCNKKAFRLLPAFLLLIIVLGLQVIGFFTDPWAAFALGLYSIYFAFLLLGCVVGWLIWALTESWKALKNRKKDLKK